ncbi:MAG: DUF819 family protein [Saprospiraceae bacterium]
MEALLLLFCLVFPALAIYLVSRPAWPAALSSIVLCYLIGIVIGNALPSLAAAAPLREVAGGSMLLALPLLLFGIDVRKSIRDGGPMLLAFGLCCLSGLICTGITALLLRNYPDGWRIAAMLTGLYTGGTPNMQAIGMALEAPVDYVVLLQASDIVLGGAYLLGLISFLPRIFARWFPASPGGGEEAVVGQNEANSFGWRDRLPPFTASVALVAAALGITAVITGDIKHDALVILLVTGLGLLVGHLTRKNPWEGAFNTGEYFLLIFCVALGMLSNFGELFTSGTDLLLFSACALTGTTLLHLLLCYLLRIDRDTVILSSVAAFYSPIFVVQVSAALGNRRLLAPGIAVGLLGFALGNFLGIGLGYTLRWLTLG